MEKMEGTAQFSSGNMFVQITVKEEPELIEEIDFKQNINNALDYQAVKAEWKDGSDGSDVAMCERESKQMFNFKTEAGDPEMAGRGVDGCLMLRLKEEETSPDPNGNFFFFFKSALNNPLLS